MTPTLQLRGAGLTYGSGASRTVALAPTDLSVLAGESVAVVGRSGAGKSTLADLALGLRRPTYGQVLVAGAPWSDPRRTPPRRQRRLVQGVPQDAAATLPPRWTIAATLATAVRRLLPHEDVESRVRAAAAAARLEAELLDRLPHELSGGQAQRAAIARALVVGPALVVADEPTSALDPSTSAEVAEGLLELTAGRTVALLVVTHDTALASRCTRRIVVTAGEATERAS